MLSGINPMSAPLLVFTGMLRATTPLSAFSDQNHVEQPSV
jgi:hypothetical protein